MTPALFFVYFAYKRSWRTVGWGLLGLGIFLLIIPSAVIGPEFNGECLGMWWHRMVTPFVVKGATSPQEINQSIPGVLMRLLTYVTPGNGRYDTHLDLHLTSLPPWMVSYLIKGVALLAWWDCSRFLCRTKTTDRSDPRLLGEVALVVLTMLFVSERSWKHHYVTVLIPYTYLVCEFFSSRVGPRSRMLLVGSWALSFVLMAATSTEVGGLFAEGQGHEIAQGMASFCGRELCSTRWSPGVSGLAVRSSAALPSLLRVSAVPRSHLPAASTPQWLSARRFNTSRRGRSGPSTFSDFRETHWFSDGVNCRL